MVLAIDGSVGSNFSATVATLTLTTNAAPDVIYAVISMAGNPTVSTLTGSTLSFTKRKSLTAGTSAAVETWYAIATGAGAYTITEGISATAKHTMIIFGVSGASTANPFDSNGSVPAAASSTVKLVSTNITTDIAADMIIGAVAAGGTGAEATNNANYIQIGTQVTSGGSGASNVRGWATYQIIGAGNSGATTATASNAATTPQAIIADAIVGYVSIPPTGFPASIYKRKPTTVNYILESLQRIKIPSWKAILSPPPYDPSSSIAGIIQRFKPFKEKYNIKKNKYDIWTSVITFPEPTGIAAIIQRYTKIIKNYWKQSSRPPQFTAWYPNLVTPSTPAPEGISAIINRQQKIIKNFILNSLKRTPFQQWKETLSPAPPAPPAPTPVVERVGGAGLRRRQIYGYIAPKPVQLIFKPKLWTRVVHHIDISISFRVAIKHEIFARGILRSKLPARIEKDVVLRSGVVVPINKTIKRNTPIIHKIETTTVVKSKRGSVDELIEDLEKLLDDNSDS